MTFFRNFAYPFKVQPIIPVNGSPMWSLTQSGAYNLMLVQHGSPVDFKGLIVVVVVVVVVVGVRPQYIALIKSLSDRVSSLLSLLRSQSAFGSTGTIVFRRRKEKK